MKKLIIIILLLLPVNAIAQPTIVFDSETYDFGVVTGDELLKHNFAVRNVGSEELIIQRLEAP